MPVLTGSLKSLTRMKDPRVATLGELVVEVEHEVGDLCFVDDEVAARAVRVQTVGLHVVLGQRLLVAEDPAGAAGSVEDGPEFLVGRGGRQSRQVPRRSGRFSSWCASRTSFHACNLESRDLDLGIERAGTRPLGGGPGYRSIISGRDVADRRPVQVTQPCVRVGITHRDHRRDPPDQNRASSWIDSSLAAKRSERR